MTATITPTRILTVSLLFLLAACARSVSTDVTRFNQFSGPPAGSFSVEPAPGQDGSLEFASNAALISEELQRIGFTRAAEGSEADYVVGYRLERTRYDAGSAERGPVDVGVGVGSGSRGTSMGVGIGFNLGSGNNNRGYINKLSVTMERAGGARVFEGHASAMSRGQSPSEIAPYLVRAVFTDFPGENGESDTIDVKLGD